MEPNCILVLFQGQPNGQNLQECITYDPFQRVFYDEECSRKQCFACSWDHRPAFVLRGLCANTDIEKRYILLPQKTFDGHVTLAGYERNSIIYRYTPQIKNLHIVFSAKLRSFLLSVKMWKG